MQVPATINVSKCPRCNSKNVEVRKDPNDKARIICKKCSLSMITAQSNTSDAVMFFERSKTNRVKYIITCLREHGNAYVGEFTLKVWGESMINAVIHDGDIVIVQKQATVNNGDIVVAMNEDNEVTLKTFYKENNHIRLQPENDTMEPIILDNVFILGKAIGLYRKF